MSKITYDNKIDLHVDSSIANVNKVSASDMNEIKSVVNNNDDDITALNTPEKWVAVGETAPTDGRRVWFSKSKNLFNNNVERKNAYVSNPGATGQVVAYSSSSATYSFINCCKVEQGKTYTISWAQSQTPSSTGVRQGCIVDNSDIVRQGVSTWINAVSYNTFTANSNGFLILCTDIYATDIQIEEGSTATAYEPYIEHKINVDNEPFIEPSQLVSVNAYTPTGGERVWFAKSKNILNIGNSTKEQNGVTSTFNGTHFTITGKATSTSANMIDNRINTFPAGTYTLSISEAIANARIILRFYASDGSTQIRSVNVGYTQNSANVTLDGTEKYWRLIFNPINGTTYNVDNYIMFEKGSTATTYEPYVDEGIYVDEEEWYSEPKILWNNPSVTTDFAEQTVSLLDNLANYSHYEILYFLSKDNTETFTTGKIPVDKDTRISVPRHFIGYRSIQPRGTSMYLSNHNQFTTYGQTTSTNTNGICIPYQILGYK